jgi:hypothetical protein
MVQGVQELLANVTDQGRPPKRRITNAQAAWDIFDELKTINEERSRQWARIQGM